MKISLNPYLVFNPEDTKSAMEFYKGIFGGELTMQTFGEAGVAKDDAEKDFIIHSELKNDSFTFMASSGHPGEVVKFGDNISMSLAGVDKTQLTEWFNKLTEGGKIDLPLAKQFWGDIYGQVTDKFGVHWMVNISSDQPQEQK